jgi:hypothetical protein
LFAAAFLTFFCLFRLYTGPSSPVHNFPTDGMVQAWRSRHGQRS